MLIFKIIIISKTRENWMEQNYVFNVSLLYQVIIPPENVK